VTSVDRWGDEETPGAVTTVRSPDDVVKNAPDTVNHFFVVRRSWNKFYIRDRKSDVPALRR